MPTTERERRSRLKAAIDDIEVAREHLKLSLMPVVELDPQRVAPIAGLIGELDVVLAGLKSLRAPGDAGDQEAA